MSKTARELIARHLAVELSERLLSKEVGPRSLEYADDLVNDLNAAGFVIVPKEPTAEMIEAGNDTDHTIESMSEHPEREEQIANFYRAMISVAVTSTTLSKAEAGR